MEELRLIPTINGSQGVEMGIVFSIVVPPCYSKKQSIDHNTVRQLIIREHSAEAIQNSKGHIYARLENEETVPIVAQRSSKEHQRRMLLLKKPSLTELPKSHDISSAKWIGDLTTSVPSDVQKSFVNNFTYIEETPEILGLRPPQIGALHSVLGYWTTSPLEPATVVMPTGTGKTETMLALLCSSKIERLLVIVPSDTLRDQITQKFESLGILQQFGVASIKCLRPVVGKVAHAFTSSEAARTFTSLCNVIIATPYALSAALPDIRRQIFELCTHLFIDEAHHVPAETWRLIRDEFKSGQVVQFTATPFREDGRRLGGRLIYSFPLREAQRQGYFSHINYTSIIDLGKQDRVIAQRAIEVLRSDLAQGLDHILMARVSRKGRAEEIAQIYKDLASDLSPVVLHSSYSANKRQEALAAIRSRLSRIIICVNMLGEGFDLPSLKIAAMHDTHKSLAVTLQFIGRFARTTGSKLGDATIVVSRPDLPFDNNFRKLYAETADWNLIIRDLSESSIKAQEETSDFEAAFGEYPEEISIRSLMPKMSTVVYRTDSDDWNPQSPLELYGDDWIVTLPIAVNQQDAVAWFVIENHSPIPWGDVKTIEEVSYDLFILYWDKHKQLLFINSSDNSSEHEELAKAICGDNVSRITGENVYRVMANMQRLIPTNVGLLDIRNRSRRFSMHVGADVEEAFPTIEEPTKLKTNIFAYGYDEGVRVSIGASLKGRIWSHRTALSIPEWMSWCNYIGTKLMDESLNIDAIMRNFIRPKVMEKRPELIPLGIEWPFDIFTNVSTELQVTHAGSSWPIIDIEFELITESKTGPIDFFIKSPDWQLPYRLVVSNSSKFIPLVSEGIITTHKQPVQLSDYLNKRGLNIFFEQDSMALIPPGLLLRPNRELPPYDSNNLLDIDWTGINLNIESQGFEHRKDSIQYHMINHIMTSHEWDIVIDDDGPGEMADIVSLKEERRELLVHLTHCKFVNSGKPRSQVEDLYKVCGQAQKSTQWRRNVPLFLQHLLRRERNRARNGQTGFIMGTPEKLYHLLEQAPILKPIFTIAIAQPGLTKSHTNSSQLELLACTENYIYDTTNGKFEVYCSP